MIFSQAPAIGSISGSSSLCTQDLILLSDFVPMSQFIQVICKGQHDIGNYQSQETNESLLNINKIEHMLTNLGKNELELRKDLTEQSYVDKIRSTFTYEMNSLKIERSILEKMMYKSG